MNGSCVKELACSQNIPNTIATVHSCRFTKHCREFKYLSCASAHISM